MNYIDLIDGEIYKGWHGTPTQYWIFKFKKPKTTRAKEMRGPGIYYNGDHYEKLVKCCRFWGLHISWKFTEATLEEKQLIEPQNIRYEIY